MGSDDPKRAKKGCARATNLKKCARTRLSPTRLQRTAKNVQPDARTLGAGQQAEGVGRGVGAPACGSRNLRAPADDGQPKGAGGVRRRKAVSCTFFSVCCTVARGSGPFRGRPGRLQCLTFYKHFRRRSSDLRFCSGRLEAGRLGRVRLRNKPKKMCTKWLVREQTRNKPQKMCSRTPASPPGSARELRPEGVGRGRRPARLWLANPRAPTGRSRPQPAASRTKPALIAAGWKRMQPECSPRTQRAASPRRPGNLRRFRKANLQVGEPWEAGSMNIAVHRPLTADFPLVGGDSVRKKRPEGTRSRPTGKRRDQWDPSTPGASRPPLRMTTLRALRALRSG